MSPISLDDVNKKVYPDYFQPRQWDALQLKLLGYTIDGMAIELGVAYHTASDLWAEVREILGISGSNGQRKLMRWALKNGLISKNF